MAMLAKVVIFASIALPVSAQSIPEQIAAHAQAAQAAERQNDFQTAVRQYEYVAGQLPRNAEMRSNLGVALYFNHDLARAIKVFGKAIALDPKLLAPHLFSGLALYRLSNPDAAVPELQQAVQISSSDVIARTWLGYAFVAQGRYEPAVAQFQAARKLDPGDIDVWYALGHTFLQIGKDATLRLLAVAPDGGRTWQLAGEQSLLQGNRQEALENFKGALQRRPDIPELRTLVAQLGGTVSAPSTSTNGKNQELEDDLYRQAHQAEQESHEAFERVVQIAPESYRAHEIMADAFAAEQRHDEAIAEYRTVLKLKPDLPGVHQAIGNSLLRKGNSDGALKELKAELQLQPGSASAYTNVGQLLLMMGDDDGAAKMLNSALQMDRPPPEVYRLLGKLDLHRKDYRAAVNRLTHYVSISKDDSTAYYLLSKAYRALGDTQQMARALDLFEKNSKDVKARNRAQEKLEALNNQRRLPEEPLDAKRSTPQ